MKKHSFSVLLCILLCLMMLMSLASCGKKEEGSGGDTDPPADSQSRPEYYWDTHESSEMPYKGSNRYLIYASYASAASRSYIIASDEKGESIVFLGGAIFMDTEGEMMDTYNDSDYVTWYIESSADFGYEPKGQKLKVRVTFFDNDKATVETMLSRFLENLAEDKVDKCIEGTFCTTALKSAGDANYTAKYVRAQFEKETDLTDGTTVRQYCQYYRAYMPFEAPNGKTVYVEVQIEEARNDPADLSDKNILNFIYDKIIIGKTAQQ